MSQNLDKQTISSQAQLVFKPFPIELEGYEDKYLVTNDGRIFSKYLNDFMKPYMSKGGYERVKVNFGSRNKKFMVHRLVALAFIPNDDPEHKIQVDHINCIRTDNRVENLRWVTPSENSIHSVEVGTRDKMMYTFTDTSTGEAKSFSNRHKILAYFKNASLWTMRKYANTGLIVPNGPFAGYLITREPIVKVQRPSSAEEQRQASRNGPAFRPDAFPKRTNHCSDVFDGVFQPCSVYFSCWISCFFQF